MEAEGLTNEQTDKVLQFQDLTGIEDMNICRDVLMRHQWDLEVNSAIWNSRDNKHTLTSINSPHYATTTIH